MSERNVAVKRVWRGCRIGGWRVVSASGKQCFCRRRHWSLSWRLRINQPAWLRWVATDHATHGAEIRLRCAGSAAHVIQQQKHADNGDDAAIQLDSSKP